MLSFQMSPQIGGITYNQKMSALTYAEMRNNGLKFVETGVEFEWGLISEF